MNTSPSSSKSPSFFKALGCLIAFIVFPILSLIHTIKCMVNGQSEWIGFAVLTIFGSLEIYGGVLHCIDPRFFVGGSFIWLCIGYVITWSINFTYLRIVKDEIEHIGRKTATH